MARAPSPSTPLFVSHGEAHHLSMGETSDAVGRVNEWESARPRNGLSPRYRWKTPDDGRASVHVPDHASFVPKSIHEEANRC
jgi:hypothetical protein